MDRTTEIIPRNHGMFDMVVTDFSEFQNDLLRIVESNNTDRFIFRGQRKEEWKLEPSLSRGAASVNDPEEILNNHRKFFLNSLRGLRGPQPPVLSDDQMWALGRHYGLKTPLLDWTRSPFVALFFAFAEPNHEDYQGRRSVFALNTVRITQKNNELKKQGASLNYLVEFVEAASNENKRLINQSGLFTRSMPNVDFESWVVNNFHENYEHSTLIRYLFPEAFRKNILKHLNWMNINYLTLFPDINGAAMHSNLKFEFPDTDLLY